MIFLIYIFIALFVVGLIVDAIGAALLSLLCAVLAYLFARRLEEKQTEYRSDPRNAKPILDTMDACERQDAECCRSKF
jgi:membrane protein implicated in regulation of membrane protease activity